MTIHHKILKPLLVTVITLFIFYLLFTQIDARSVIQVLSSANPFYLFLSVLVMMTILPLGVKRWQIILNVTGHSFSFWRCFTIFMAALPLTCITPSKSGDVVKAYYLKDDIPMSKTIGTVFTERIFDLFSLIFLSFLGSIFYRNVEFLIILILILLAIAALFLMSNENLRIPFIRDSWNSIFQNVILSMSVLTRNKETFFIVLSLSLTSWILVAFQTVLFFYALNISIPFMFTMANIPIAILIGLVPVTLGGMGTRDAAIILFFSDYGVPSELLGVGILFSFVRYLLLFLIGIPFMIMERTSN